MLVGLFSGCWWFVGLCFDCVSVLLASGVCDLVLVFSVCCLVVVYGLCGFVFCRFTLLIWCDCLWGWCLWVSWCFYTSRFGWLCSSVVWANF